MKKIILLILIAVLCLSSCSPKDEASVNNQDIKFSSAHMWSDELFYSSKHWQLTLLGSGRSVDSDLEIIGKGPLLMLIFYSAKGDELPPIGTYELTGTNTTKPFNMHSWGNFDTSDTYYLITAYEIMPGSSLEIQSITKTHIVVKYDVSFMNDDGSLLTKLSGTFDNSYTSYFEYGSIYW